MPATCSLTAFVRLEAALDNGVSNFRPVTRIVDFTFDLGRLLDALHWV